jgi:toxin ParE1/3/4
MKVGYTLEAAGDMDAIYTYIEARNRAAADRLGEFPYIGRYGLVAGTHEWTVKGLPYIIVHELHVEADELVVLGVFHGAQDREDG